MSQQNCRISSRQRLQVREFKRDAGTVSFLGDGEVLCGLCEDFELGEGRQGAAPSGCVHREGCERYWNFLGDLTSD
jgi:hypothetical protein